MTEQNIEGRDVGSGISIIREATDEVGSGPRLHRHPYRETFVIVRGRALFTLGDEQREAGGGEVLVVAAGTPHKFAVLGPGTYEAVHIHESDHFITEWLE
ncbi:cupin domain-containing protein [Amycolatopsis sp. H20-H5]|uniref:cupin domain-containing protein n=1 Tax=Amycolatopsis sp. H20-H5 TaxID=3046309 RepID=UPI002DBC2B85|nr:cupin domain-containing protein [Amycolatopsis sp. H20-H5]MEC3974843.1 cupin domain-containing protein [Amycolatopsis sp. H20-H5]